MSYIKDKYIDLNYSLEEAKKTIDRYIEYMEANTSPDYISKEEYIEDLKNILSILNGEDE